MPDTEERTTPCAKCGSSPRTSGSYCRPCQKERWQTYSAANKDKIQAQRARFRKENRRSLAEKQRRFRETHREYYRAYNAEYAERNQEALADYQKRYRAENAAAIRIKDSARRIAEPEKLAARNAVAKAIMSGRLVVTPCEVCGLEPKKINGYQRIEAHHHNGYAPEYRLDVIFLCRTHHREADAEQKEESWTR